MNVFKEPLCHFVIGAMMIFAYFELLPSNSEQGSDSQNIVIGQADVQRLKESWAKSWRKPPTKQQLDDLIDSAIRDEIYYREGIKLGLDQNDTIVRNRMIQKMRFLQSQQLNEPTEQDLFALLEKNADKYQSEPSYSFRQLYLGHHVEFSVAQKMLTQLQQQTLNEAEIDKPLSIPKKLNHVSYSAAKRQFGEKFAKSLTAQPWPTGAEPQWAGPLESGFGLHLIKLTKVINGQAGSLDTPSLRQRVENDWRAEQGDLLEQRTIAELRKKYSINVTQ